MRRGAGTQRDKEMRNKNGRIERKRLGARGGETSRRMSCYVKETFRVFRARRSWFLHHLMKFACYSPSGHIWSLIGAFLFLYYRFLLRFIKIKPRLPTVGVSRRTLNWNSSNRHRIRAPRDSQRTAVTETLPKEL